jgi:hypothetical protein
MAHLSAHGISAALPEGFEGRIFRRTPGEGEIALPVAHFATFPLPSEVGDFGSGAVTLMGPNDVFAVLFEYGPESLSAPLFARQGRPRRFGPDDFKPYVLRRGLAGHAGTQWFFTEGGRPFTFYSVIGNHARRNRLVPVVNRLVEGLAIEPASAGPVGGAPWN